MGDRNVQMRVGCCSLSVLERRGDVDPGLVIGGWKPQKIADRDHLMGGLSREWGFEDVEVEKGRVSILLFNLSNCFKHWTFKVVSDPGIPGSENDIDEPIGLQAQFTSHL